MSFDFTIDIQLTELGFPDLLQQTFSSSSEYSVSPSPPPPATPLTTHESSLSHRPPLPPAAPLTTQTANGTDVEVAQSSQDTTTPLQKSDPTAAPETADPPVQKRVRKWHRWERRTSDVEETSDYSDEEEELEENQDEEDEEGLNNESNHSGDYRCSICKLQLPSKLKLQDHTNLHTGARPYCCAECGKRFCQIHSYRVHLRKHVKAKGETTFMCRVCLVSFNTERGLKVHHLKTHTEKEFFECDLCKRVFTCRDKCVEHIKSHSCAVTINCETCGRKCATPKDLAHHHRRTMCGPSYKCTDCSVTFPDKDSLLRHSFSHLGLQPYTCVRCSSHFRLASLYRKHICEPKRINCVACLRGFIGQEAFEQHKKDTGCWGNQEPKGDEIRCLECGEKFDTSEELKKHAGAHQRILKCADCGKGFRSALLLMSHMGGHAGTSPCLCQSCGLGFPHQQDYGSHLKTCGQTPPPTSVPKKRKASKRAPSKPLCTPPVQALPPPVQALPPPEPVGPPPEPVGPPPEDVCPPKELVLSDLKRPPPPALNLFLFLPVNQTQTNEQTVQSLLSGNAMHLQPQAALLPVSSQNIQLNDNLGAILNVPMDLVGMEQEQHCQAPLDLSTKCKSAPSNTPLLPAKGEMEDLEISEEDDGTKRQTYTSRESNMIVNTNPPKNDMCSIVKQFKVDPMDLSLNVTSPDLIIDIEEEPLFPVGDFDS